MSEYVGIGNNYETVELELEVSGSGAAPPVGIAME